MHDIVIKNIYTMQLSLLNLETALMEKLDSTEERMTPTMEQEVEDLNCA